MFDEESRIHLKHPQGIEKIYMSVGLKDLNYVFKEIWSVGASLLFCFIFSSDS